MSRPDELTQAASSASGTAVSATTEAKGSQPTVAAPSAASPREPAVQEENRLRRALRYAWGELSRDKRWLVCTTAFALIWAVELWLVQAKTLISPQDTGERFAIGAPIVRAVFDLLFVGIFCVALGRLGLVAAALATFGIDLLLVTYWYYFARPLSMLTIVHQWGEGAHIGSLGKAIWPADAAMWLSIALAVKLGLLIASHRRAFSRRFGLATAGVLAAAYLVLFTVIGFVDPLDKILTNRGLGRLGMIRGYTGPWLAELYYLGNNEILNQALETRNHKSDRLTPIEAPIDIHNQLVIIQAESLCFNVIGYKCKVRGPDGKEQEVEATPFLNQLRSASRFYRILAMHDNGSADADFVTLNGVPPSSHVLNYNIPNYPYKDTLPQFLSQHGFQTIGLHGNTGNFYRRRDAWERIGFSRIIFMEELEGPDFDLHPDKWGVSDKNLFHASTQLIRMSDLNNRFCHFLVTMTSHSPFDLVKLGEQELYPGTTTPGELYMNSVRYLDTALRDYILTLPKGTTVMIYGDHSAGLEWRDFVSDRVKGKDYVPCFIYTVGEDLAATQKTRNDPISLDGRLSLLDLVTYLRQQVDRSYPVSDAAKSAAAAGSAPSP